MEMNLIGCETTSINEIELAWECPSCGKMYHEYLEPSDELIDAIEDGRLIPMSCPYYGVTKKRRMKMTFKTQEDFTEKINELILEGKEQGFSTKDISDKWHTFGDLYHHRMILTYVILKSYPDLSWKSKQHHDGTMFDDSFIVGINTTVGQYSYHYDLEYWSLFDIRELDKAPEYDGHKPEDITRLMSLL